MIVLRYATAWLAVVSGCHAARAGDTDTPLPALVTPTPTATPTAPQTPTLTATPTATLTATDAFPFGPATPIGHYTCPTLQRGGPFHSFLAPADTRVAFVNGDDWLAIVNRSPTGALAPDYAPTDLVDLKDGRARTAAECGSQRECLRRDAAMALHAMFDAMRAEGIEGRVQSAFRGFGTQCWVFDSWARQARGGFCEATEQSALPGHSQHQLGTDARRIHQGVDGRRSSNGPGGLSRRLRVHAWRHLARRLRLAVRVRGLLSIHPDDRKGASRCATRTDRPVPIDPKTGYKSEPWHVRYIGVDAAARYHDAWLESRPGSPDEIAPGTMASRRTRPPRRHRASGVRRLSMRRVCHSRKRRNPRAV